MAARERTGDAGVSVHPSDPVMSNTALFLLGFIVLTGGMAMGLHLAGVPAAWIGAGGIVMLGLGILLAVTKTRQRETPPGDQW